jgi:serine/threonine-protein kinase
VIAEIVSSITEENNAGVALKADQVLAAKGDASASAAVVVERQTIAQAQAKRSQLADQYPKSEIVQTAAAVAAAQTNHWNESLIYSQRSVDLAQNQTQLAGALKNLSLAQERTGDYQDAATNAKRGLDLNPTDPQLAYDLRSIYHSAKDQIIAQAADAKMGKAAKNLADGVNQPELNDGGFRATQNADPRAQTAGSSGDASSMAATAQARVEINRLKDAENALSLGDAQRALSEAESIRSADPLVAARGGTIEARAWAVLKELTKAVTLISQAIDAYARLGRKGDLADAYTRRAGWRNDQNRPADAVADASLALQNDPRLAQAYYERSRGDEALGKTDEAAQDLDAAVKLDPEFMNEREDFHKRHGDVASVPWAQSAGSRRGILCGILGALALALFLLKGPVERLLAKRTSAVHPESFSLPGGTPGPTPVVQAREPERQATRGLNLEGALVDGGKYRIGKILGQGGMGTVYKARDLGLDRDVAIKRLNEALLASPHELDRFIKEGRMVAKLRHPGIVTVHAHVREGDLSLIVFEFIEGGTLYDALSEAGGPMPPSRVLKILNQVAEAVDYAHEASVIHRDLKPSNIMLQKGDKALVTDFGIARVLDAGLVTMTQTVVGTPPYMAPEQADAVVSRQLDVYALGVIAYELLTGARPFEGPMAQADKRAGKFTPASQRVAGLSAAVDPIFKKVLDPENKKRHARCTDFCRELDAALLQPTPPRA